MWYISFSRENGDNNNILSKQHILMRRIESTSCCNFKTGETPAKTGQEKIVNTNFHSEGHGFIVSHCHCVRVESPDCYKTKKGQRTRQFIADIIACFINSVLPFL